MADNILIDEGTTTALKTKDIGGVQHSVAILYDGTGAEAGTSGNPLGTDIISALPAGTNNIGDVDVASCALPTGASTAANQTTIIGHLDGVEALLTTIDADTSTIAGAVSGSEMQVDVVSSALPTGAATEATLSTLDGKVTTCNTGAVVISSGTVTAVTAITNALPAGNNNIGDVDVASLPALAAGTNLIGKSSAGLDVSSAYDGSTALPIKFAAIAASSSGDNTLIAAVTSKKIRVLGYTLIAAGTVNVRFESGAGGTALTGVMPLIANTGMSPNGSFPLFETASNTLLNLELSAAVSVAGHLAYVEV